jgi:hypothetical protein
METHKSTSSNKGGEKRKKKGVCFGGLASCAGGEIDAAEFVVGGEKTIELAQVTGLGRAARWVGYSIEVLSCPRNLALARTNLSRLIDLCVPSNPPQ